MEGEMPRTTLYEKLQFWIELRAPVRWRGPIRVACTPALAVLWISHTLQDVDDD
jgi:hypothetical protein